MSTFGSTQEELNVPDAAMIKATKMKQNTATLNGLSVQMQIMEQRQDLIFQKLESLEGLYRTVIGMYETLQRQRALELNKMVGNGPTA